MRRLQLSDRTLTDDDVFVIAEIGSNHMGDPDLCCEMIKKVAECGADAVKLQKRDNRAMFTKTAYGAPYENEWSYGATYGEHREALDNFTPREWELFKALAEKYGLIFFATPFEEYSADFLHGLGVNLWKIASCDVKNVPLVHYVAKFGQPMIISTGGASWADIMRLASIIEPVNPNFALLHCISLYPNKDEDLNLLAITYLRQRYPEKLIGFSSHHPGVLPCMLARAMGASIFEVHFTMNRSLKGTDHGFSLEPKGLRQLCEDIKRVTPMLGKAIREIREAEKSGFVLKMGKSLYPARALEKGKIVNMDDVVVKSPADPDGLQPYDLSAIIGRELTQDCATGVAFRKEWFK